MSSKQTTIAPSPKEKLKVKWLTALNAMLADIENWSTENDWAVRRVHKLMNSEELGNYQATCLIMQKESARIMVEPVGHQSPGTDGVVDLYLMPGLDDIASLYLKNDKWRVHYYFPNDVMALNGHVDPMQQAKSRVLNKRNILLVLNHMVGHASGQD